MNQSGGKRQSNGNSINDCHTHKCARAVFLFVCKTKLSHRTLLLLFSQSFPWSSRHPYYFSSHQQTSTSAEKKSPKNNTEGILDPLNQTERNIQESRKQKRNDELQRSSDHPHHYLLTVKTGSFSLAPCQMLTKLSSQFWALRISFCLSIYLSLHLSPSFSIDSKLHHTRVRVFRKSWLETKIEDDQ